MNQQGLLAREEPFSFFGPAVVANQASATYGPLAGAKAMDAFLVTVAPSTSVTLTDQNNQQTSFPSAMFTVGLILPWSPAAFTNIGTAGNFVPLYK